MRATILWGIACLTLVACREGSTLHGGDTATGGSGQETTGGVATGGQGTAGSTGATTTSGTTGSSGMTVNSVTVGDPNGMQLDVFVITQYTTCVIGDVCNANNPTCANSVVVSQFSGAHTFASNSNLRIVAPGSPLIAAAQQSLCLTPTMAQQDQNAIFATLNGNFLAQVAADTGSTLPLKLVVHSLALDGNVTGLSMTAYATTPGQNWYISASDVQGIIAPLLSKSSAFALVTTVLRDDNVASEIVPIFSTSQIGDAVAGVGYSWVAKTRDGFSTDGFTLTNVMHEWQHQLAWGINHLSGFTSAFPNNTYTGGCSTTKNPNQWFPDSNDCTVDPDWSGCGASACPNEDAFHDHVLSAHWVAGRRTITNHCRDGNQNYGETSVDAGGDCPTN